MKVIGITGVAGCGKDLFCQLLIKQLSKIKPELTARRFALADALKVELNPTLINLYGIDIFHCNREQKELVRPMLVAHGKVRRVQSQGTHWTTIVENEMNKVQPDVAIVTDIRYAEYEKDEDFWLLQHLQGSLVHITLNVDNKRLQAPNSDEAANDPILAQKADFEVLWDKSDGSQEDIKEKCMPWVNSFINLYF